MTRAHIEQKKGVSEHTSLNNKCTKYLTFPHCFTKKRTLALDKLTLNTLPGYFFWCLVTVVMGTRLVDFVVAVTIKRSRPWEGPRAVVTIATKLKYQMPGIPCLFSFCLINYISTGIALLNRLWN